MSKEKNMRTITSINVSITKEDGITQNCSFGYSGIVHTPVDEFLSFLVKEGFYDDIQATKRFTVSQEVMKRLKD